MPLNGTFGVLSENARNWKDLEYKVIILPLHIILAEEGWGTWASSYEETSISAIFSWTCSKDK